MATPTQPQLQQVTKAMMSSQALNTVASICIFTCFFSRIQVTITLSLFALTKKILHVNIRIQICVGVWVCIISFPSMHPFLLFIWARLQRGRGLISHSPLAMLRYYVHKKYEQNWWQWAALVEPWIWGLAHSLKTAWAQTTVRTCSVAQKHMEATLLSTGKTLTYRLRR